MYFNAVHVPLGHIFTLDLLGKYYLKWQNRNIILAVICVLCSKPFRVCILQRAVCPSVHVTIPCLWSMKVLPAWEWQIGEGDWLVELCSKL